ncbi:unnamed protein product [Nippostrongylus brasiliensis]|uniref:Uncharacterized protein n=1 Tax=Nippostrongylus brasiliensis TaxID=27835 RepID=A0A0N4XED8_NIPBR|nr:unnamed protein product [Nippostrongylus brasiliensis]
MVQLTRFFQIIPPRNTVLNINPFRIETLHLRDRRIFTRNNNWISPSPAGTVHDTKQLLPVMACIPCILVSHSRPSTCSTACSSRLLTISLLCTYYSQICTLFRVPTPHELEKRFHQKLMNKPFFVEKSPGRSTEVSIQDKMEKHGDQCYVLRSTNHSGDSSRRIRQPHDRSGGILRGARRSTTLLCATEDPSARYQHVRFNMEKNLHNSEVAYEWYEILVAADKKSELDRLAFLNNLDSKVFKEPNMQGNQNYPKMVEYFRDHSRISVGEMTKKHVGITKKH